MLYKTIALQGCSDVNIEPILPIINSRIFQRLQYIKQLGVSNLVFISANHTRFEHSLGAYWHMCKRTTRWLNAGLITEEEAINLRLLALLHDIGHGPYSHATERFYPVDHNACGLILIDQLQTEIEACGGNIKLLKSLFERTNPLWRANGHCALGTDKLDYLLRDALNTTQSLRFRQYDLLNHVYWIENKLVVDGKILDQVKHLQSDYVNMHKNVYFMQGCIIAQQFLQQIVGHGLASGSISSKMLPMMTDNDLICVLKGNQNSLVRNLFDRLQYRDLPKTAVIIRAKEARRSYNSRKPTVVFRRPLAELARFSIFDDRDFSTQHEAEIARLIGIPSEDVLVTPVVSAHRFVPQNVHVYEDNRIVSTLEECFPSHYRDLEETTTDYAAVRVCVPEQHRTKAASPGIAQKIHDHLMRLI